MNTTSVVFVPKGSISQIISYLHKRNFDFIPAIDRKILRIFGWPQSGWIDVGETSLSRGDFYYKLTHAKAAMVSVTLKPGETTAIFLKNLSQTFNISQEEIKKEYDKLASYPEGLFFPETYQLPIGIEARHLLYYLISLSENANKNLSQKIFGEYNPNRWRRYQIIASIIEKESASIDEMPLVSSVIYNRLNKNMKLQMDGTLNYGEFSNLKVTPERIKNDTSRYNTYKYAGLPPHPVSSVSVDALKAAIFPAKSDYLYFVRDKSGKHTFSKNYDEHLKAIKGGR
ncbi:MAG: endolytic transglycosylase MltG [Sulfurospirillaceae bacterium]|jgi:UPF0755 protein|nr:endolytic transglycosylase MltG [Sulfurospirillaceae bacterium]